MNPRWFFTEVADPNASAFLKEHDDIRLAVNAIMTLDAAFGSLHAHLRAANDPATAAYSTTIPTRKPLLPFQSPIESCVIQLMP